MSGVQAAGVDRTLAALADPFGRATVELLQSGPRPAGELARALGLTPAAMSRRLRALRESGLVEDSHPEFDARVRIYALRREPIAELIGWLSRAERTWTEQLRSFKAHVEDRGGG